MANGSKAIGRYAKVNINFKYILTVLDYFSKFVWITPLKIKSGEEITRSFESVLEECSGRHPKN